jgi:hypothetical protein
MDARQQPAPPFPRPPDRHLIHNPNHQPPTAHAYPAYPPSTQPPQPQQAQQTQQPLHVPFATATDPYAASRRDPFFPQTSNHARQHSHGAPDGASQAHNERNGGWGNTGTHRTIIRESTARCCVWGQSRHPRSGRRLCLRRRWHSRMAGWIAQRHGDARGHGCEDSSRTTHLHICCRTR